MAFERRHRCRLEPGVQSTLPVRHWAVEVLTDEGLEELVADTQMALIELVNNSLIHAAGSPVDIEIIVKGRSLEVSVTDGARALPEKRSPSPDDLTGRGLGIVEAVCEAWGVELAGTGKRVWCRLEAG